MAFRYLLRNNIIVYTSCIIELKTAKMTWVTVLQKNLFLII